MAKKKPSAKTERHATESSTPTPRVAIALALSSAVAAGAHEIVWARLLGHVVGNSSYGVGLALAVFMIGSGVGAMVVPRTPLFTQPARGYAITEAAIGVGALLVLALCLLAPPPSTLFGLEGVVALALDLGTISLVAAIPACAMGATFPLLVAAIADHSPRHATPLYAAGLVGAVVGTLGAALGLGPALGLDVTGVIAAVLNVVIAIAAMKMLHAGTSSRETFALDAEDRRAILHFAAAGILGLGAQAVWSRCVTPYAGVSVFTFAAIVAVYVSGQALGFALYEREAKVGHVARLAAAPLAVSTMGVLALVPAEVARDNAPIAWFSRSLLVIALVVGPVAMMLGASQASVLREVERRTASHGRRAAAVAGFGTIASAIGALFAVFVGTPLVGPRWTLLLLGLPMLALSHERRHVTAIAALATALLALASLGPRYFLGPAYDHAETLYAKLDVQDTTAIVTVDLPVEPRIRRLVANGVSYSGDSIFAQRYMRLLAHLPSLAARENERAAVICVGTGTTLDALRGYAFERIDAIDISPSIRETLRFFSHVNHDAIRDDRVTLVLEDGARFLGTANARYDVITLEPPPPRAPGGSTLYTREIYESAKHALKSGGVIAQWLPLHGMSSAEARAVVRTFTEVFPQATIHYAERNEAILVSGGESHVERLTRPGVALDLARIGFTGVDPFTDSLVVSARGVEGDVIRDAWPMPEYAPLAGANLARDPLDVFLEEIAAQATGDGSGAIFAALAPSFVRIQEGRAKGGDPDRVRRGLASLLARAPSDPYVQHVFGFGPLLEQRLQRLDLSDTERETVEGAMRNARGHVPIP